MCIRDRYGSITSTTLVQFVELTRLLGAQHFVFYVAASVSPSVRLNLDAYRADDLVTTVNRLKFFLHNVVILVLHFSCKSAYRAT